ncbi:Uncharacterised protein [uncultured archaeon]|nr:Uncharacterised protein [uncultured archaeon]
MVTTAGRHSKAFPIAFLLLSLALSGAAHAATTTGDVSLSIKDSQLGPVANASVVLAYTVTDPVLGELHKREAILSDSAGMAVKRITADLGAPVSVNVSIHGASDYFSENWTGAISRFVNLPLEDFSVRIIDSGGNPIPNVPIILYAPDGSATELVSDADGFKYFANYRDDETLALRLLYGDGNLVWYIKPDGQRHSLQVYTYSLEVRAFNENGSALLTNAMLYYRGARDEVKQSLGIINFFSQIPRGNVTVVLRYGDRMIADSFLLSASLYKAYYFDFAPPVISAPTLVPARPVPENDVTVTVRVEDVGTGSSGIPPTHNFISPVVLHYSEDGQVWNEAYMQPQDDYSVYKARIPGQPANRVIRYYITAFDLENNSASSPQYAFSTFVGGNTPEPEGSNPWKILPSAFGSFADARLAIPAALVLIALAYLAISFFRKPAESA